MFFHFFHTVKFFGFEKQIFSYEYSLFEIQNTNTYIIAVVESAGVLNNNEYATKEKYLFINLTDDFYPKSKQDIKDIYYTIINSGMNDFTFFCDKSYKECLDDVNEISNDQKLLSHFNNFVHIYNSFKSIDTEFDTLGKVNVHITKNYNEDQINEINKKFKEITDEIIKDDDTNETKVTNVSNNTIVENNTNKYDKLCIGAASCRISV